jgi:hypothetical protein
MERLLSQVNKKLPGVARDAMETPVTQGEMYMAIQQGAKKKAWS